MWLLQRSPIEFAALYRMLDFLFPFELLLPEPDLLPEPPLELLPELPEEVLAVPADAPVEPLFP